MLHAFGPLRLRVGTVWRTEIEPLLERDRKSVLEAKLVLAELCTRHPEQFHAGQARTLQRRFRDWRAVHGPEPEVFFEQVAVPGREAAIDFTHATDLGVTIAGEPLSHLLFEFVLSYSGWRWVAVAFGETFEALVTGVQGALWALGGVPAVLRSDKLSAATHELKRSGGRDLTVRFRAVLDHYGLQSSRITPGRAHENGVAEQAHRRLKSLLAQALLIRGHADFADVSVDADGPMDARTRPQVLGNRFAIPTGRFIKSAHKPSSGCLLKKEIGEEESRNGQRPANHDEPSVTWVLRGTHFANPSPAEIVVVDRRK